MTCLAPLTLAALGPWTYAGFLDDPAPPAPPPAAVAPPPFALTPPVRPAAPPAPAATPPSRPAAVSPPPAPVVIRRPAPITYRMPDASGQVWEHADPAWLQSFVMDRNRQFVRTCTTGSCR